MGSQLCDAAKACFLFIPSTFPIVGDDIGDTPGNRLEQLTTVIRETIEYGTGQIAQFYRFNPSFDIQNGYYEIIVYRNEYVKENPEEFGLSEMDAAKLDNPPPESFMIAMCTLLNELIYFCDFEEDATLDLFSVDEDGNDLPIRHVTSCRINPQTYADYNEYEDGLDEEDS